MADRTQIPGAPEGFSAPGNLTPEELAAFMRRLRFGGSSFTVPGRERTAAGDWSGPEPTPENQVTPPTPLEPGSPGDVSAMLQFAKEAAPSINGSYTAGVMKKLGRTTGPASPQNPAEYEALNPSSGPGARDLPEDITQRKLFTSGYEAQQAGEKTKAETEKAKAEAAKAQAEADSVSDEGKTHATTLRAIGDILRYGDPDEQTRQALMDQAVSLSGAPRVERKPEEPAPAPEPSIWDKIKGFVGGALGGGPLGMGAPGAGAPTPTPAGPGAAVVPPYWNPMPDQGTAPATPKIVPDPNDATKGYYMGKPYRRTHGGWVRVG
jgi:hypothetical protein